MNLTELHVGERCASNKVININDNNNELGIRVAKLSSTAQITESDLLKEAPGSNSCCCKSLSHDRK